MSLQEKVLPMRECQKFLLPIVLPVHVAIERLLLRRIIMGPLLERDIVYLGGSFGGGSVVCGGDKLCYCDTVHFLLVAEIGG